MAAVTAPVATPVGATTPMTVVDFDAADASSVASVAGAPLLTQMQDDKDLRKTLGMTTEGTCYRHANQQVLRATDGRNPQDDVIGNSSNIGSIEFGKNKYESTHKHGEEEADGNCPCRGQHIPRFSVSISVHPCRVCESEYKAFVKRLETIASDSEITPENVDEKVAAIQRHRKSFAKVINHVQALHTDATAFSHFTENWGEAVLTETTGKRRSSKLSGRPPRSGKAPRRPSFTSVTAMDSDSSDNEKTLDQKGEKNLEASGSEHEESSNAEDDLEEETDRRRRAVSKQIMVWIRAFTRRVDQVKEWEYMDNEQNKRVAKFKVQQLESKLAAMQAIIDNQTAQIAEQKATIQKQERTISHDLKRIKMIATKRANSQRDLMSPTEGSVRRKGSHLASTSSPKQSIERKSSLPVPSSSPMLPRSTTSVPGPLTSSSSSPLPTPATSVSAISAPALPSTDDDSATPVMLVSTELNSSGPGRRPPKANISDLTMQSTDPPARKAPPSSSISDLTLQSITPDTMINSDPHATSTSQEAPPRIPLRHKSNPTELAAANENNQPRIGSAPSIVNEVDDEHSSPTSTQSKSLPLSPREDAPRPPVRYLSDQDSVEVLRQNSANVRNANGLEQFDGGIKHQFRNGRVGNDPPTPPLRQPSQDDDTLLSAAVTAVSTTSTSATVPTYGNSDVSAPNGNVSKSASHHTEFYSHSAGSLLPPSFGGSSIARPLNKKQTPISSSTEATMAETMSEKKQTPSSSPPPPPPPPSSPPTSATPDDFSQTSDASVKAGKTHGSSARSSPVARRGISSKTSESEVEFLPLIVNPINELRLSSFDPAQVLASAGPHVVVTLEEPPPPPPSLDRRKQSGEVTFVPSPQKDNAVDQLRISNIDPANVIGTAYSRTPFSQRKARKQLSNPDRAFFSPESSESGSMAANDFRLSKIGPDSFKQSLISDKLSRNARRGRALSGDSKESSSSKNKKREWNWSRSGSQDESQSSHSLSGSQPLPTPPTETDGNPTSKKEEIEFDARREFDLTSSEESEAITSYAQIAFDANPLLLEASQALSTPPVMHPRRRSMDHYRSSPDIGRASAQESVRQRRSTMAFAQQTESSPSISDHRRKSIDTSLLPKKAPPPQPEPTQDISFDGVQVGIINERTILSTDEENIFDDRIFSSSKNKGVAPTGGESSYLLNSGAATMTVTVAANGAMGTTSNSVPAYDDADTSEMEEQFNHATSAPASAQNGSSSRDTDDDEVEDDEFEEFDDMTSGPLEEHQKLLMFARTQNLSPVSALTTGSYLLEQQLGGKSEMFDEEEDQGPRKGLGGGGKELPMEQFLDLDDDTTMADEDGQNSGEPKISPRRSSRRMQNQPAQFGQRISSRNSINRLAAPRPVRANVDERNVKKVIHVAGQRVQDRYGDGGEYTGTILLSGNLPHGSGKMLYDNNRQYEGEWRDGRWHGRGRWINPNGDCYDGTFVFDARHGSGTYTWKNGNVYQGDFYEDKRQGKGKFNFANGNVYEGDFVNGVFEGQGRYEFEGGYYDGHWKSGRYHGMGFLLFSDNSSYKGDFLDGVAHGRGEETGVDGSIRKGIWENGKPVDEGSYS